MGEDAFLRGLVRRALTNRICTYCGSKRRGAAPLSAVMDAIQTGIRYSYADEATAAVPAEIEVEYLTSTHVLYDIAAAEGLNWPEELVEDMGRSLTEDGWVHAPGGQWMGAHEDEWLGYSWTSFAQAVKHRSRFHFRARPRTRSYDDRVSPHEMLPFLARLVRRHRMLRKLLAHSAVVRVRPGAHAQSVADLGPPPAAGVPAGRMNPAGIPYFYGSMDQATALAEARPKQGELATVGNWVLARDIYVLDLTRGLDAPSIFSGRWSEHDLVHFIYSFVDEISKPVEHDGSEHIEYVPTQVISEFFAQSFKYANGRRLDGIIFPSALVHGAKNLVLFPVWSYKEEPEWGQLITLVGSQQVLPP